MSRVLALLAVLTTYLIFHLLYVDGSALDSSVHSADVEYADFVAQKTHAPLEKSRFTKLVNTWLGAGESTEEEMLADAGKRVHTPRHPVRLCPTCDCKTVGAFLADPAFAIPVPPVAKLREQIRDTGSFSTRSSLRYLLHNIPLAASLRGVFLQETTVAKQLSQHYTCPDSLISFNFTGLALDKPTQYVYTRTGSGGRLKTWADRKPYMQRHVDMLHGHTDLVSVEGYEGGIPAEARQLVWIIVEDAVKIEPGLEKLLHASGIRMSCTQFAEQITDQCCSLPLLLLWPHPSLWQSSMER